MARLIEPRSTEEVSVVARHRCPSFVFGLALGPRALETWWWSFAERDHFTTIPDEQASGEEMAAIDAAILAALAGIPDYRRHLDEMQELPG